MRQPGFIMAALGAMAAAPVGAQADDPVPPGAREMLETAVASGNEQEIRTVVKVAKATWPQSTAAIDALVEDATSRARAARYARIAEKGLLTDWSGEIRLGGSTATGNSGRTTTTAELELGRDGPDWRNAAEIQLYYSFSGDRDPTKRVTAFWQSDFKLTDHRFLYARIAYLKNFSAGIRDRMVESAGYGATFTRGKRLDGSLAVGPAARQTRFYDGDLRQDLAVRVGTRVNWNLWRETRLSNVNTLYLAANSTIDNTVSLRTSILDGLSVILSFNLQWEAEPAPTYEPLSTLTSISIGFAF